MPAEFDTQVVGVKEALRDLGRLDKDLARQLKKDARNIMAPIVQDVKAAIPSARQNLSGFSRNWKSQRSGKFLTPWSGPTSKKYVKAKTSTKKPTEFGGVTRDLAAFYVSWAGGINAVFDMAGRKSNSLLAANLTTLFGPPSRIMYPAAEKNAETVERGMNEVVDQIVKATNEQLGRNIR
jgi:hypothetical protein